MIGKLGFFQKAMEGAEELPLEKAVKIGLIDRNVE